MEQVGVELQLPGAGCHQGWRPSSLASRRHRRTAQRRGATCPGTHRQLAAELEPPSFTMSALRCQVSGPDGGRDPCDSCPSKVTHGSCKSHSPAQGKELSSDKQWRCPKGEAFLQGSLEDRLPRERAQPTGSNRSPLPTPAAAPPMPICHI